MGLDKAVYTLVIALVCLSSLITIAIIFVPGFADIAPTLIAATLGPLTTALSILGGLLAARGIGKEAEKQAQASENEGGSE